MKKTHFIVSIVPLAVLLISVLAFAGDQATTNLTINATVNARAKLTVSTNTINFPDADPDSTPSISAAENGVSVTVKVRTGSASVATLAHQAAGDLSSGKNSIPISNVTWTAAGSGFSKGVMSSSAAQAVGSWTGSGTQSGTLNFALANSWDYATGTYTASSTFTLTAP
jgi:hypothetical protein